ncbi:putative storkhead-box protein 2 [Triplophysa rosa]|uniref:Storkhead-box protein 2 n=1 Tax=Triplophysa rosa TaxID=992332 RepID=A0A9W7X043_TRIRA|nr:putative storkhead-box protein 2 [Triplophysa rosa]
MKKTRSTNLRRAWPGSDLSERALERIRSRSEKDYHHHKHFPPAPPPTHISPSPRGYITPAWVTSLRVRTYKS